MSDFGEVGYYSTDDRPDDQQLCVITPNGRRTPRFAELVRRHVDLVHSATLRMVCDAHLAEDVTQAVFIALAQNALSLTARPVFVRWLHRTAQNLAAKTVRTDVRRRHPRTGGRTMNELLATEPGLSRRSETAADAWNTSRRISTRRWGN